MCVISELPGLHPVEVMHAGVRLSRVVPAHPVRQRGETVERVPEHHSQLLHYQQPSRSIVTSRLR